MVNCWIGSVVNFYDILHSFRAGRAMGTASLNVKMLHNMTANREDVLYEVFLDLIKSDDTLDQESCMEILFGYGIVPHTDRVICI